MAGGYVCLLLVLVSAVSDPVFAIVARPSSVFHHYPQPENVQVGPSQHGQLDTPRTHLYVPLPRRDEGNVRAEGDNAGSIPQLPAASGNGEYSQPDTTRQTGPNDNNGAPNVAASGNVSPMSYPAAATAVGAVNRNDGGVVRGPMAATGDVYSPPASQDKGTNEPRPGGETHNEASSDEINSSNVHSLRRGPSYPPAYVPSYARPPTPSIGRQRFGDNRYQNGVQSYRRPSWTANAAARPQYSIGGAVRPSYQQPRYSQPLNNGGNRGTAYTAPPVRNPAPYVTPYAAPVSRAPASYQRPVNTYSSPASRPQGGPQYNAPSYPAYSPTAATPYESEPAYQCPPVSADFCYNRDAGHYSHSSDQQCFVQCDQFGESYVRSCAGGTQWRGGYSDEPALGNMCS